LGFAVLLNAVVTVLRASADPEDNRPLRARADALAWDVEQALTSWPERSCDFAILLSPSPGELQSPFGRP
jgi:hypothetical protein